MCFTTGVSIFCMGKLPPCYGGRGISGRAEFPAEAFAHGGAGVVESDDGECDFAGPLAVLLQSALQDSQGLVIHF